MAMAMAMGCEVVGRREQRSAGEGWPLQDTRAAGEDIVLWEMRSTRSTRRLTCSRAAADLRVGLWKCNTQLAAHHGRVQTAGARSQIYGTGMEWSGDVVCWGDQAAQADDQGIRLVTLLPGSGWFAPLGTCLRPGLHCPSVPVACAMFLLAGDLAPEKAGRSTSLAAWYVQWINGPREDHPLCGSQQSLPTARRREKAARKLKSRGSRRRSGLQRTSRWPVIIAL
ncbi:hypothetical protein P154DRAFT_581484 [Amniculicola lignicola CBS 123094]|uniref:Uncharacterized protein n=1 Tax=Amniculicola lignicola CBS 123094 TaxID=1392246 RepID=A0A6A5W0L7_9PLEO|nr:hypothetical protein P154DRAFT_581484 [Amniculicola lignicola CBS 123094]